MQQINSFALILLTCSVFLTTHATSIKYYSAPECFSEQVDGYVFGYDGNPVLFSAPTTSVQAYQDGNPLEMVDATKYFLYAPFTSNIGDFDTDMENNSFSSIDTSTTTSITLELQKAISGNFFLNFEHDSKYYQASYFISDNSQNYYRVGKSDINTFQVKSIKIEFIPKSDINIREIINITDLSVQRSDNVIAAFGGDYEKPVDIYMYSTCKDEKLSSELVELELRSPIFTITNSQENYSFLLKNTDSDNDGVKDLYDNCRLLSNSSQTDINQNGIGDSCEFDSDNDSFPDEVDNCRNIANPGQEDDDRDGIGNACDNCALYNPGQLDINSSGVGDVCEQREKYVVANDDDSDGVVNSADNCKDISNPDQLDSDNDGVGDVCDNCASYQNTNQSDLNKNGIGDICEDSDSDGIDSLQDNCPNIANADQADRDNDGIGNLCEDDDRDSVLEIYDNCPLIYNPGQQDIDNDNIGNACDESDDRLIESNKIIFILLLIFAISVFLVGIYSMSQKLKK